MNILEKRPLFTAILCFIISAVISSNIIHIKPLFFTLLFVLLLAFIAMVVLRLKHKNDYCPKLNSVILIIFLSVVAMIGQFSSYVNRYDEDIAFEQDVIIDCTVTDIQHQKENYCIFVARASVKGLKNQKLKFSYFGKEDISVGDKFSCTANLSSIYYGGISKDESYDAAKGISYIAEDVSHLQKYATEKTTLRYAFNFIKNHTKDKILSICSNDGGALIVSLLLGSKDALDTQINSDFKALGISHMLAISGMHISTLLFGVLYLLNEFRLKKRASTVITVFVVIFYIGISGLAASAVRAAIMFSVVAFSTFIRRDSDSFTSLAFAVMCILLVQPFSVYDVGLWLSALATMGILVCVALLKERETKLHSSIASRFFNYIYVSVHISLFAFMFTLPIVCIIFGYISTLTILSNLIFAIFVEALMYMSFLIPVLLFFRPYVMLCSALAEFIITMADIGAEIPYAIVSVNYPIFWIFVIIFCIYVLYLLCKKLDPTENLKRKFMLSFTSLALVLTACLIHSNTIISTSYVSGSGNDEFIICKNEKDVTVFDFSSASNSSAYFISEQALKMHITEIDTYVISHYTTKYKTFLPRLDSYTELGCVLLPAPQSESDYECALSIISELNTHGIEYELYYPETTTEAGLTQFVISRLSESDKYSYLLGIYIDDCRLTYFTPSVINLLSDGEMSEIISYSDGVIFGKHGGTTSRVSDFLIHDKTKYIVVNNKNLAPTDELLNQIVKVEDVYFFTSATIK